MHLRCQVPPEVPLQSEFVGPVPLLLQPNMLHRQWRHLSRLPHDLKFPGQDQGSQRLDPRLPFRATDRLFRYLARGLVLLHHRLRPHDSPLRLPLRYLA